ncbi:MAG: acoC [Peptococcaceae bacterium]|jgi:pyruvate dehydrogenase E2 component (dihydrolipoamide acetyltransferase)|nr:acoC [Peptococcaceae bacterium]
MAFEIFMPKMGLTMSKGTVAKWLKKEGDAVKKGEEILEVMTEKITNTIEAPADGILLKIVVPEGEEVYIGSLLGIIGAAGETLDEIENKPSISPAIASRGENGEKTKITPAARKLAQENGIDYTNLSGTGPGGRITREDIEKAIAGLAPEPAKRETNVYEEKAESDRKNIAEVIPYTGMRKAIGDNMAHSWAVAPKVTHHVSVDVTNLLTLRKTLNEDRKEKEKISISDLLVKIVAKALEMKPHINVTLDKSEIKVLNDINIGLAVALEKGLVVPVIRNANKKSLSQISREVKELAQKARENRISPEEMREGTFTITNLGAYGSVDWFTPIINQPESAILGIGRIVEQPVVYQGRITIRPMIGLSLAFDHRVIDGAPAAEFLAVVLKLIESPMKVLI